MVDALGWLCSLILLATLITQIRAQWLARSAKGVSRWLFVGQTVASAGFTAYSALVGNWVFTVTNAALFVSAIFGWWMTRHFTRNSGQSPRRASGTPEHFRSKLLRRWCP
jgi:hypothetical protein